jgi:hypothetical protein
MCTTKNFKKYWLHPLQKFPGPINNKSFELNFQLLDLYKNALKVCLKSIELFSTSNLTHLAIAFILFFKRLSLSRF